MKYEVVEVAFQAGPGWGLQPFRLVCTPLLTFLAPAHRKHHTPTPSLLQSRAITKTAGEKMLGEHISPSNLIAKSFH